jgi:hypothetical protein
MSSIRISNETISKFITIDLQAWREAHGPEAYISVTELATRIGGKPDSVEALVRKMDNVSVLRGEAAQKVNEALGKSFDITARKGKKGTDETNGFYPGVRLMDESEAKAMAARAAREERASNALKVTIGTDYPVGPATSVRFDDEGTAFITIKGALDAVLLALE